MNRARIVRLIGIVGMGPFFVSAAANHDCPDSKIKIERLRAAGFAAKSQAEFLKTLREQKDLFPIFSLVRSSNESGIAEGINDNFPGPVLMSRDGSLLVRWSCDPQSKTYGVVEMWQFTGNPAPQKSYKSLRLDYRAGKRHQDNPTSCLKCHATRSDKVKTMADFAPIWQRYPMWKFEKGEMVGFHDDVVGKKTWAQKNPEAHQLAVSKAKAQALKKDGCYDALPWPDLDLTSPAPWAAQNKSPRYEERPNLLITQALAGQIVSRAPMPTVEGDKARRIFLCSVLGEKTVRELTLNDDTRPAFRRACDAKTVKDVERLCKDEDVAKFFPVEGFPINGPGQASNKGFDDGDAPPAEYLRDRWLEKVIAKHPQSSGLRGIVKRLPPEYLDQSHRKDVEQGCLQEPIKRLVFAFDDQKKAVAACSWISKEAIALSAPVGANAGTTRLLDESQDQSDRKHAH